MSSPSLLLAIEASASEGGEGGIRTLGTVACTTVFETVPIDHSGTSPKLIEPNLDNLTSGALFSELREYIREFCVLVIILANAKD